MPFFKIIFEFNLGITFGEYLLKTVNNLYDLGFIEFRTDPNDKTGYLIHESFLPQKSNLVIQIYFQKWGETRLFLITR